MPTEDEARPAGLSDKVILLHGIWMRSGITARLDARLSAAGFQVTRLDYASIKAPLSQHRQRLDQLIERLGGPVHLVGHSLGGVVAVHYLQQGSHPSTQVARVLCLGSPLLGSTLARRLQSLRLDKLGLGTAREILLPGLHPWSGPQQIGVIAGEVSLGLSVLLGPLPRPNDGTVAVAETRLPGLSDHVSVRASHTALLFSETAAKLSVRFLRHGRFAL